MESVTVGGLSIGTGRPKLIAPITAESKAELLQAAQAVPHSTAQLAEWRLDRFEPVTRKESLLDAAQALCAALGDLPVLATYRTVKEGGGGVISETQYAALIETLADSGLVDLIDIELFTGEDFVRREISYCHEKGVKVILSSHDFARTPPKEEMTARLRRMEALGADIAKLAVMPQTPEDVLTLLSATGEVSATAARPVVTMSMGRLGAVSRIAGEVFGSAPIFGAVGQSSAPGQLEAAALAKALSLLSPEENA